MLYSEYYPLLNEARKRQFLSGQEEALFFLLNGQFNAELRYLIRLLKEGIKLKKLEQVFHIFFPLGTVKQYMRVIDRQIGTYYGIASIRYDCLREFLRYDNVGDIPLNKINEILDCSNKKHEKIKFISFFAYIVFFVTVFDIFF